MSKLILFLFALTLACGGIDDTQDLDHRTLLVTTVLHADGTSQRIETVGEIDTNWYGYEESDELTVQKQITFIPSQYGIRNGNQALNETRCPVGGYTVAPNYCVVPSVKTYNWDNQLTNAYDAQLGQQLRTAFVESVAGTWGGAGDFVQKVNDPFLAINARAVIDNTGCDAGGGLGAACMRHAESGVTTFNNKRYRTMIPLNGYRAQLLIDGPQLVDWIIQSPAPAPYHHLRNLMKHEIGHALGHGHRPSAQGPTPMHPETQAWQSFLDFQTDEKNMRKNFSPF